ncbi:ribonuclease H-like domain-containing protein [uncultured Corynebacterium sp.]|uniref:ribonuclease H-like domain-containing protein n=1 Tax=uncultured Corynebacterium sp. TaxID=159447 RepID=UPI0025DEF3E3|nr:ribonuclease H-like domain-containing protein [uncultured Corynebacterium sp.]
MNTQDTVPQPVTGPDLVGCRYRLVRDRSARGVLPEATESARRRAALGSHHRAAVLAALEDPVVIEDGPDADLATLEAIAAGAPLIVGGVLRHERPPGAKAFAGIDEESRPDLLVNLGDGYMPVLIAAHKLLEPRRRRTEAARILPVARLGRQGVLGRTVRQGIVVDETRKLRHNAADAVRLGQAAALLHRIGASCGLVGGIGADPARIVVVEEGPRLTAYRSALRRARAAIHALERADAPGGDEQPAARVDGVEWRLGEWPLAPRRIRECRGCRWRDACEEELRAADDISLLLPGNRGDEYRAAGISTIHQLARTPSAGEHRYLALLSVSGERAALRAEETTAPRADVEIDVDLEAYPGHGAYLWGAWSPEDGYVPHVTWRPPGPEGLGGDAEAENFARFWDWLMSRRAAAHADGLTFRAYCWAAEGENHWLRHSARRFGGREFVVADEPARIIAVPEVGEVEKFISSSEWVDLFRVTKRQLISPEGLGLKVVAPLAGFAWRDDDADGEASLTFYRQAVGIGDGAEDGAGAAGTAGVAGASGAEGAEDDRPGELAEAARAKLLRYNGDDCRSTAVVREWLDSGRAAREIPFVGELEDRDALRGDTIGE